MKKACQHKRFLSIMVLVTILTAFPAPSSFAFGQATPSRNQDYLRDLEKLSRVIGAAHGLRVICNGRGDQYWRTFMQDLLALEAPEQGSLRRSMVSAFNGGFSNETRGTRACDSTVSAEEGAYARQGRELAEGLAAYYFPQPSR